MKTYKLVISTPEGNIFASEVIKISLRGIEGDLAILANHTPFVTSIKPCIMRIEIKAGEKAMKLDGGVLSVGPWGARVLSGGSTWVD